MSESTTVPPIRGTEPAVPIPVPIESLRLIPLAEVAHLCGISVRTLLRQIHSRELKAKRMGKGWSVPHNEVVRLLTP